MSWLVVTLAMYRRVFRRATELTVRSWAVFGALFVYVAAMQLAAVVAARLGFLGGIVLSLVWAACVGSFLHLVEMMVRSGTASFEDFRRSFGVYVWDVVGVTFLLWVFFAVVTPLLATMPQGRGIVLGLELVVVVLFNAVPELIYLGHCSSVDLLAQSYAFISENWIEWFPATLALAALALWFGALPFTGLLGWLQDALIALLVVFTMVVRGLLFLELHGSSRRGRAFRYRMGG